MRISVIIPLYNKAHYVATAITSVLTQTFHDYELIVVDDCSTDNSVKIVERMTDSRISLIRLEENSGVSVARNNGVAASHGEYLCFLDADDWWEPTFLEEMAKLFTEFPDAGIYGTNYTIVNETKHKTRVARIGIEEGFAKGYINYCQAYAKTMYMPLWTGAVSIPRRVFDKMGGFPKGIKLGEDFLLWIHIALKYKVAFLNKPLSNYNQDVDATYRETHHLHDPKVHMLWHLNDLESFEQSNPDYKQLVDNLRTNTLQSYLIDKRYRDDARKELAKVDWSNQPARIRNLYSEPIWILNTINFIKAKGSHVKVFIRKLK